MENTAMNMPVLALRGLTIFPNCLLTFDVEREISIRALERAMESDQQIFLVAQREINVPLPGEKDLYSMGTISVIRQILRISENAVRVMMEGRRRARRRRRWQAPPPPPACGPARPGGGCCGRAGSGPTCAACGRRSPTSRAMWSR